MIIDRLYQLANERGPICIGLDTKLDFIPDYLAKNKTLDLNEKIFKFNKAIIDCTYDLAACYKIQIAFYEAQGVQGIIAYQNTLSYIRSKENIVIADIKRGDIFSTAEQYAKAHFSGDFEADFLTVNPYMGIDAIQPYFPYLDTGQKGLFVLVKTSNPSSKDFQELICENKPLYLHIAKKIEEWGEKYIGKSGYSAIGSVIGLTYPEEFSEVKKVARHTFYLIPGYGAQGGIGKDLAKIFKKEFNGIVNSSRGIIAAHKGIDETESFVNITRKKVIEMKQDIDQWQ
ncbi:MAG: orotidine-5'-phosphate decarboxylase [Candidatus Atribacteria bacterium]|nr:orotidine-5'-phosphate decarboxylase [Candidatus Atribacteria bacterium]